jgi:hypothetical protein
MTGPTTTTTEICKLCCKGCLLLNKWVDSLPTSVHMGDVVQRLMVILVIAFVKGDAKSGNTLVSQFGRKNCKCRVPRLCLTGWKDLNNPKHNCLWVQMAG